MDTYDPLVPADPEEWLTLDEGERVVLVRAYHRQARIRLPNTGLHAAMHVVVENQIAMRDECVRRTLERLMSEGLDRHDAVHAIGSVLAQQLWKTLRGEGSPGANTEAYYRELDKLTASRWERAR